MRKIVNKILLILFVVVGVILSLVGCGQKQEDESSVPAPSSQADASDTQQTSSVIEPEAPSQQASENPNHSSSQPENGIVDRIETGNAAFDQKFAENPIDSAYEQANRSAASTREMVEVANRFAEIWKTETEAAYQKLLEKAGGDKEKFESEQSEWKKTLEEERQKLEDAAAGGGTMVQIEQYNSLRTLYRARANQLYQALYTYDQNFSFTYTGEAVG